MVNTSEASVKTTQEWNQINWGKAQRKVFKLQTKIYQAIESGQKAKARNLQRLLFKSYYAKLLAVRRVTQDNQGKKTAGVDGVKSLSPKQRHELVDELSKSYKAKPLRRVWIPKPGKAEKRPLGIPTIRDRVIQALVKICLEPQWESTFEGTSYGFRPGRNTQDAISQIYLKINKMPCYVLDADRSKCFDKINHQYLLSKLDCPQKQKRLIKQWLKAGVLDNGCFNNTDTGTPQGGVISPLCANIALDGMIREIEGLFPKTKAPKIIRYADDFVILHKDYEIIEICKSETQKWLEKVGLVLSEEKTRVCHTLNTITVEDKEIQPGFDFLGFEIRQYKVGKHKSGKLGGPGNRLLGFKTIIKPSKKAIKRHTDKIKSAIKAHKTAPQAALIKHLNPIIRGWGNYYATVSSKETYTNMDNKIWSMLRAWTVSRTGKASHKKLSKYFHKDRNKSWKFSAKDGLRLVSHSEIPIKRHVLIQPQRSPYDGDFMYWSKRLGNYVGTPTRVAKLLKKQKGVCPYCKQHFMPDDTLEIDHIQPRSLGGKNEYKNLQLLHRHCHDNKTTKDGSSDSTHNSGLIELGAV